MEVVSALLDAYTAALIAIVTVDDYAVAVFRTLEHDPTVAETSVDRFGRTAKAGSGSATRSHA